jgi:hypothetical protein
LRPLPQYRRHSASPTAAAPTAASWRPSRPARLLADQAVRMPTVNERDVDFISKRLHNYEYNPVWGFLADQSWLG